jgi:hypothetical protein
VLGAYAWDTLLEEIEKCRLLCHNCHAETHHPDLEIETLLSQVPCSNR